MRKTTYRVGEALESDNDALIDLSSRCSMEGQVGLCIDRGPEFLALNRLEGDDVRVGVARSDTGRPIGCVTVAAKSVYVNGEVRPISYIGDFKIDPEFRSSSTTLKLMHFIREQCRQIEGGELSFLTVLEGNDAILRHAGTSSQIGIQRIGTVRSYSIGLLWKRKLPASRFKVVRACGSDIEEMIDLWSHAAPQRNFSIAFTVDSFADWLTNAPGLSIDDYWLARSADGALVGFVGVWDQSSFKQTCITSYSKSLTAFRLGFNLLAPRFGTPKLPPVGGALPLLSAVHLSVKPGDTEVLRALTLAIYDNYRNSNYSFFTVGVDRREALTPAFKGLLAQPTDVAAAVWSHNGSFPTLDSRPIHHEIALV